MSISRDEWLKALSDAGMAIVDDPSAITIKEFAEMFGMSLTTATRHLVALVAKGHAIETSRHGMASDGRRCRMRAFRLLDVNPKPRAQKRKPS